MNTQDDFLPFNADEYRAVVNPTELDLQAYGYGRRLVLKAGEVKDPKRACVQFTRTRIARKAVKRLRRFLEVWTVKQGRQLLLLAQEIGFPAAYRRITGRNPKKAGAVMAEAQRRNSLRRQLLSEHGVPEEIMQGWSVEDMRRVLKNPELMVDLDEHGKPRNYDPEPSTREQGLAEMYGDVDISEYVTEAEAPRRQGHHGIQDEGRAGDFVDVTSFIEEIPDGAKDLEEMTAEAALKFDVEKGEVAGAIPKSVQVAQQSFKGIQATGEAKPVVDEKDLQQPSEEVKPPKAVDAITDEQKEVRSLRAQIERVGGKWHPRSKAPKLREQLEELTKA